MLIHPLHSNPNARMKIARPYGDPVVIGSDARVYFDLSGMTTEHLIKYFEGYRDEPYLCPEGYWTVGWGHKLEHGETYLMDNMPRNLREVWIDGTFSRDLAEAKYYAAQHTPNWETLDYPRKAVLISMVYQLGITKYIGFKEMHHALASNNYTRAANEMLDSRWAMQTGERAWHHAKVMVGDAKWLAPTVDINVSVEKLEEQRVNPWKHDFDLE